MVDRGWAWRPGDKGVRRARRGQGKLERGESEGTEQVVQGIGEKVRGNREWEKWSGNGVGG